MSNENTVEDEEPVKKASKLPLILGFLLALVGGGGAFFAVQSGLLLGSEVDDAKATSAEPEVESADPLSDLAFVSVPPIVVTLGSASDSRHLRFSASLEVPSQHQSDVEHLMPRITDALNSFLQAVDEGDVANRDALLRLRVQMLHRVRLVVGEDRVRDLLVSEFILN